MQAQYSIDELVSTYPAQVREAHVPVQHIALRTSHTRPPDTSQGAEAFEFGFVIKTSGGDELDVRAPTNTDLSSWMSAFNTLMMGSHSCMLHGTSGHWRRPPPTAVVYHRGGPGAPM